MKYKTLLASAKNLIDNEKYTISLLSNVSAFIFESIDTLNWAGFYLHKDSLLILGPFQGKVACNIIEPKKGVCGTALDLKKTMVIPDVHQHDNHIACDANSQSEVVIPIMINDFVYGVLDIDSPITNRFDEDLVKFLEELVTYIEKVIPNLI
ncbi:conserved hypothetical protein [Alteracholeplasma palmae J233]|uniref:GAF domain-containing protein n=1 Tax=Alteracholeplasma palmae (strain ATCC 49389 / J233) TaxID=1318466 RepID=U4KK00_ALTPJ|nr:GAF domain-containing protein [Alteracholeplasma palmae]CCV63818.1 conserved hypothetical protein [Alteracholeplasma palmae J233]